MHLRSRFRVVVFVMLALAAGLLRGETEAQLVERYNQARAKLHSGDAAGAMEAVNLLLEREPRMQAAWKLRALVKWQLKDVSGARVDASHALFLSPKDPEAYRLRAGLRFEQADRPGALEDLDKAIALRPANAEYYGARGHVRFENGDMEAALPDLNRAIELDAAQVVFAYLYRAQVHEALGESKAALADYDHYLSLEPEDVTARDLRSWLRFELRSWDGAMEDAKKALEKHPDNASAMRALGYAQYARGDYPAAAATLTKLADMVRDDEQVAPYVLLVRHLAQHRNGRSADNLLVRRAATWKSADWPRNLASFLDGQLTEEQLDALAEQGSNETERNERQCEANFYIGMARLFAGDRPAARVRFKLCVGSRLRDFVEYVLSEAELERMK